MQAVIHKKGIIAMTLGLLIIALGFLWYVNSAKLAAQARTILLSQVNQALNGRLEASHIEISLSKVVIRQAVVFDSQNTAVATCERLIMDYGWRDFLTGQIGMEAVRDITLDTPVLTLARRQDGYWNIGTLVKPVSEGKTPYRGLINIKNGTVILTDSAKIWRVEDVHAVVTSADRLGLEIRQGNLHYADQKVAVTGYVEDLAGAANLNLAGTASDFDLSAVAGEFPLQGKCTLDTKLAGTANKPVITGTMDMPAGVLNNIAFTGAKGDFRWTEHVLHIEQASAGSLGGSIVFAGTIRLDDKNSYQMHVAGNSLDVVQLMEASKPPSVRSAPPAVSGLISVQADITGAAIVEYAAGDFTMPSGTFADTAFADVRGTFRYDGRQLIFDHVQAAMDGGIVTGSGTLGIERGEYVLTLAGAGLESGLLTNKQVQGKLAFDAQAQGAGDFQNAFVHGSFRMGSGTVSGIPFTSARGNFTRQGGQYSFDAVNFQLLGGLITGDVVPSGTSFHVKLQTPGGIVEGTKEQLLEQALQGLLKQDKPAHQSTQSTTAEQSGDNPRDKTDSVLNRLKGLRDKKR